MVHPADSEPYSTARLPRRIVHKRLRAARTRAENPFPVPVVIIERGVVPRRLRTGRRQVIRAERNLPVLCIVSKAAPVLLLDHVPPCIVSPARICNVVIAVKSRRLIQRRALPGIARNNPVSASPGVIAEESAPQTSGPVCNSMQTA